MKTPPLTRILVAVMVCAAVGSGAAPRAAVAQGAEAYTRGDVEFMQGMIHHHAQALLMAAMSASHGGSAKVQLLSKKITLSQRDEIGMMRVWLQYRKQEVPDTAPHSMTMPGMPDMDMDTRMPGMLNVQQMKQLDGVRGVAFDRLFLTGMIGHHKGALKMVADLIAAPPSGQESEIFRFISDVDSDQRAEIGAMQQLLYNLPGSTTP